MKQGQLERILKGCIDIPGIAKELIAQGFASPITKKIFPTGADFFALKNDVNRIKRLPDGWFRDEFLSLLHRRKVEISPVEFEKHVPRQPAQAHIASLSGKGYIYRMFFTFEWVTAFDYTKYNPALVESYNVLGLKTDDWYWAEEDQAGNPGYARIVGIEDGGAYDDYKDNSNYVRPVRLSQ
ncbi:MAG: hypothetical protein WC364_13750 [Eubacteriales bacterium]